MRCSMAQRYELFYGEYEKDFYVPFMESQGITGECIWEGELFDHPYYEDENSNGMD